MTSKDKLTGIFLNQYMGFPNLLSHIERRYVLSAAHCQDTSSPEGTIIEVVLGDHDLSIDPDCPSSSCKLAQRFDIKVADVIVHEQWKGPAKVSDGYDILLIR